MHIHMNDHACMYVYIQCIYIYPCILHICVCVNMCMGISV